MNPRGLATGGNTALPTQRVNPGQNTTSTPVNQGSVGDSTRPTLANGQTTTPVTTTPATRPTGAGYGTVPANTNWINPSGGQTPAATTPTPTTTPTAPTGAATNNTTPPSPDPVTTPAAPTYSTADYFRRALGIDGGNNAGTAVLPPAATQNFTSEQINQGLAAVTTPTQWTAPPEGMFTAPSTPDSPILLRIGQNGPSINPTQVQNIMNNRGTQAAMDVLRQDLAYQSPAAQLANAVRQQQTSAAALPQMTQDLRNVPQLYANPVTRALLPENIRRAEETRLNGGPDWRIASFGDAINGNTVTRAVPTSDFRAPTGAAPTLTPAQQQSNLVADFVNSWLPNMNNPGARGLAQTYDVNQLNSALSSAPEWRQAMVANRLTGLNPQQLQVALTTSGLTLPQFLAQAVSRLAG